MNERIKELYKQAHSIRYHDGDPMRDGNPPTVYWEGEVSAAKFAELIVQECAGIAHGSDTPSKDIKEHFGVQE
jgi:hypothetical protein